MRWNYLALALCTYSLTVPAHALAADALIPVPEARKVEDGAIRNHINLRGGAGSAGESGRPVICMQISATSRLSVESCGTGSGFLHDDPSPEIAHFRLKWATHQWDIPNGRIDLQAGLGFAELQMGEDVPGFSFGGPDGADYASTAGPEASLSLQWLYPLEMGIELIGDATFGAAWFNYAPELIIPREKFAPFGEISAGVGW